MANRGFTHGFLQRHSAQSLQNYERAHSEGKEQLVGQLLASDNQDAYLIDVKNAFSVGDELLLITPKGNYPLKVTELVDNKGTPLLRAPGSVIKSMPPPVAIDSRDRPMCFLIKRSEHDHH